MAGPFRSDSADQCFQGRIGESYKLVDCESRKNPIAILISLPSTDAVTRIGEP
jgi:hypothetical protein